MPNAKAPKREAEEPWASRSFSVNVYLIKRGIESNILYILYIDMHYFIQVDMGVLLLSFL